MIRKSLIPALALALFIPVACTGADGTTDGGSDTDASSTSTSSTSTSSTSTSGATESTGMTGSASDSDGTSTTTDSSTSGTSGTTTADTDTGGSPALAESCAKACEVVIACYPDEWDSLDACVATCVNESTPVEPDAECEAAFVAFNECLGMAECADFESEDLCLAEGEQINAVCESGGEECSGSAGSDPNGTECSVSEECPDYTHEIICTAESCTCYEDDVMTAVCPQQMNVCMDFDPSILDDIGADCCGW